MKENICMRCCKRSCSFRKYDREDCPYEIMPPQLYERERGSESDKEKATADSWQKSNPLLKHFHIKEPAIDFDALKITRRLLAEVNDTTDAVIVEAIKKEAARQGVTDLYLIDRELVKKVITGAIPKRGRWEVWTDLETGDACTCSACQEQYSSSVIGVYKYCPSCGAKMDGEEVEK